MPATDIWDDPEVKTASDYVRFDNVGDSIIGEIVALTKHTFEDGKIVPKLTIRTDAGDEVALTAGQAQLKAKLIEARPRVGDRIKAVFTGIEKRAGGKTLKLFDVSIKPGAAKPAADEF